MDGSWWPNLTRSSGYCNMSFVAKYPGTASNQIFIVEVGLIQSICLEKNVVFFFLPAPGRAC